MVRVRRLELRTSCVRGTRSTGLSYTLVGPIRLSLFGTKANEPCIRKMREHFKPHWSTLFVCAPAGMKRRALLEAEPKHRILSGPKPCRCNKRRKQNREHWVLSDKPKMAIP